MTTLRAHQVEMVNALTRAVDHGASAVLLVAPTGAGKTVIIAHVARRHLSHSPSYRVLVLVHRRELVRQAAAKLAAAGLAVHVIAGDHDALDPSARVVVASVQTLTARPDLRPAATLVLWDEAHHVAAVTFRAVYTCYPAALHVGFTATPVRADGAPLGDMFSAIVQTTSVRALTDAGWLVPCAVFGPAEPTQALSMSPVEAYFTHCAGRAAVVFCGSVADAERAAEQLCDSGVSAAAVDGTLATRERDRRLAAFDAGEIQVLTNCMVLTEGWDAARVSACILARRCSHAGALLQMVGRVLRPAPSKTGAVLVDLHGSCLALGLPDEEREWSLSGTACRRLNPLDRMQQCSECWALFPPAPSCPRCGECRIAAKKYARVMRERQKLIDYREAPQWKRDEIDMGKLMGRAMKTGKSVEWAEWVFRKRHGRAPIRRPAQEVA